MTKIGKIGKIGKRYLGPLVIGSIKKKPINTKIKKIISSQNILYQFIRNNKKVFPQKHFQSDKKILIELLLNWYSKFKCFKNFLQNFGDLSQFW